LSQNFSPSKLIIIRNRITTRFFQPKKVTVTNDNVEAVRNSDIIIISGLKRLTIIFLNNVRNKLSEQIS